MSMPGTIKPGEKADISNDWKVPFGSRLSVVVPSFTSSVPGQTLVASKGL